MYSSIFYVLATSTTTPACVALPKGRHLQINHTLRPHLWLKPDTVCDLCSVAHTFIIVWAQYIIACSKQLAFSSMKQTYEETPDCHDSEVLETTLSNWFSCCQEPSGIEFQSSVCVERNGHSAQVMSKGNTECHTKRKQRSLMRETMRHHTTVSANTSSFLIFMCLILFLSLQSSKKCKWQDKATFTSKHEHRWERS